MWGWLSRIKHTTVFSFHLMIMYKDGTDEMNVFMLYFFYSVCEEKTIYPLYNNHWSVNTMWLITSSKTFVSRAFIFQNNPIRWREINRNTKASFFFWKRSKPTAIVTEILFLLKEEFYFHHFKHIREEGGEKRKTQNDFFQVVI